ncbi:type III pantothenate kinase [Sphingobacteriales bacterium UPWRP_1]|nr:hypothetical protein BVG80_13595 [Sphingobacteriales bacterium TSM_CSM]PSJ75357.1 type III pantothenate kinase [Sphingobacteriales bacterium UPWRP_1]
MNLCLDIGNTRTKAAVFNAAGQLQTLQVYTGKPTRRQISRLIQAQKITQAILSAVATYNNSLNDTLQNHTRHFIHFSHQTPVPVKNAYQTPATLGLDRLAAVVGAQHRFPQTNLLVIDAGTCITYDFLDAGGTYHGGGISPGIATKFKALHTFTGRLPLITVQPAETANIPLVGNNTQNSILSGVIWGTIAEVAGIVHQYRQQFDPLKILFTGGDAIFFENRLKSKIFACPNLVPEGLNKILLYNAGKM